MYKFHSFVSVIEVATFYCFKAKLENAAENKWRFPV